MSNLHVRITAPKEVIFEGDIKSLSSVNSAGAFDILPEHSKFVTLVEKKPILLRFPDKTERKFEFDLAIIHVHEEQIDIYVNPSEAEKII